MKHKNFSYAKYGYIFSIPFVVAFLIFAFYPLWYTFSIAFSDMRGIPTKEQEFHFQTKTIETDSGETITKLAPFENFKTVGTLKSFKQSLGNTFLIWGINFIPQILLALVLAVLFTGRRTKIKGQGFFKVLFYMPNIITAATIAVLFNSLFMFPTGPVNDFLMSAGILQEGKNFAVDRNSARLIVAFIQFWMWYGYTMLILISGILGLNPEMYESADIDGANSLQQFFFITLPNLRTIMIYTLVTSLIGGLNMFDIPQLYAQGGPDNATKTTSIFIYSQAFAGSYIYNTAAAASIIMFIIIAILSSFIFYFMRDKDAAKLEKLKRDEKRSRKGGKLL